MYSTVVSDVGTVRSNNQDSAFAGMPAHAVADGDEMLAGEGGILSFKFACRTSAIGEPVT